MAGKVHIVGAGPGDPELLTLKALKALREADVVLYDRLVGPETLAYANPAAELVPAGKHEGEQEAVQQWICERLLEEARKGRSVVRLKGGDPCVFGRGGEEWLFLAENGIETEIVPGVSSSVAVPELAGIPLTCRGVARAFAVVTGHCRNGGAVDWKQFAAIDTLVVLMGVSCRDRIARELIAAGRYAEEPAAFIERGSTPQERVIVTTLGEAAAGRTQVDAPAVFVIGEVVRLRAELRAAVREHAEVVA